MINDWQDVLYKHKCQVIAEPNLGWNEKKLEEILREAIKACAEECMANNDADWIFTSLSGGLDSSFCLAVVRELFPKTVIKTLTVGGNEKHPDIQFARLVAKKFNAFHTEIVPTPNDKIFWSSAYKNAFEVEDPTDGDIAVFALFYEMSLCGARAAITHDGIDELLGGYWPHRKDDGRGQEDAFVHFWWQLAPDHLIPLQRDADHFGIKLILPYLQIPVVKYIAGIPVNQRTSHDVSKIPLRNIAKKYLPPEIIERKKVGFRSGLAKF